MLKSLAENIQQSFVLFLLILVSLIISPGQSHDPFNLIKLSTLSFGIALNLLFWILVNYKVISSTLKDIWFVFPLLSTIFISSILNHIDADIFFGDFGRNTGLLSYVCFITLFVISSTFKKSTVRFVPYCLITIALINIFLSNVNILGDFSTIWSSPTGKYFGTFGNSNFFSAFLGISSIAAFSLIFVYTSKLRVILIICFCVYANFVIYKANSLQGNLVSIVGILVVIFLRFNKVISRSAKFILLLATLIMFVLIFFGSIGLGPLKFLYQSSAVIRFEYWKTALNLIKNHALLGVGPDNFADWYRTYRTDSLFEITGPNVITTSAHNELLDIGSSFGIFALLAYSLFLIMIFLRLIKYLRSSKFDPYFVSIFACWIGYLIQAQISVVNLSITSWGWLMGGTLVSITRGKEHSGGTTKYRITSILKILTTSVSITSFIFVSILSFIPFKNDKLFFQSLREGSASKLIEVSTSKPLNIYYLNYASRLLKDFDYLNESLELALISSEINQRNFVAWNLILENPIASSDQKSRALAKIKSLDVKALEKTQ